MREREKELEGEREELEDERVRGVRGRETEKVKELEGRTRQGSLGQGAFIKVTVELLRAVPPLWVPLAVSRGKVRHQTCFLCHDDEPRDASLLLATQTRHTPRQDASVAAHELGQNENVSVLNIQVQRTEGAGLAVLPGRLHQQLCVGGRQVMALHHGVATLTLLNHDLLEVSDV